MLCLLETISHRFQDLKTLSPHSCSVESCLHDYDVNIDNGLTDEEVSKRQSVYGLNALAEEPPTPLWKLILEQFEDYLVQILLVSAVLSFVLAFFENGGESSVTAFVEPFVILLILILNAIVGVWQENNAESALNALKKMQSEKARCIRNGVVNPNLPAEQLVPGDIIRVLLPYFVCCVAPCRRQSPCRLPNSVSKESDASCGGKCADRRKPHGSQRSINLSSTIPFRTPMSAQPWTRVFPRR